jgi:hypothetical protein
MAYFARLTSHHATLPNLRYYPCGSRMTRVKPSQVGDGKVNCYPRVQCGRCPSPVCALEFDRITASHIPIQSLFLSSPALSTLISCLDFATFSSVFLFPSPYSTPLLLLSSPSYRLDPQISSRPKTQTSLLSASRLPVYLYIVPSSVRLSAQQSRKERCKGYPFLFGA